MPRSVVRRRLAPLLLLALAPVLAAARPSLPGASTAPAAATAPLDTALARMGGAEALRRVTRVRFEMLTQWQRIGFDGRPSADAPSYELHSDLRDYAIPAWRNTRRFAVPGVATGAPPVWREIADVVRDSVAIRHAPTTPTGASVWGPLNVAYVDERRELFAFAPERALLAAREAPDLRALPDTTIAGAPHARVAATIAGFAATLFLRRGDGLPALARWRAPHPNDFGLVPWGTMEVELWYANWAAQPGGLVYPMQWDVRRVGRPYKRMTVLAAAFDVAASPDSFAVPEALRGAYLATARRPMHDVPLDSARLLDGRLASFGAPGAPAGAVRLGRRWLLLEAGQAPLNAERAAAWLRAADPEATLAGALVTPPLTGSGGAAWLAAQRIPVHAGPGAAPFVAAVLRGHAAPPGALAAVPRGRWMRVDGDSLWLEPLDLPDAPGTLVAWVPSLRWVYSATLSNPVHRARVLAHARARGWAVERLGSARAVASPVPTTRAAR